MTDAAIKACLPADADFASHSVPGACYRSLEDLPMESRDTLLDCVLQMEGAITLCDVSKRTPEKLGGAVKSLQQFETIEQAVKVLSVKPPPTPEAIEQALRDISQDDEAPSEDDEDQKAIRNRQTALAKDDTGYFGFMG